MSKNENQIEVLDSEGSPIGLKTRKEIDKLHDIFAVAYVIVLSGSNVVLSQIPQNSNGQKLYEGMIGVSAAAIVRQNEKPEMVALRALHEDLSLDASDVKLLAAEMISFPHGVKRMVNTFYCVIDRELDFNRKEVAQLRQFSRAQLDESLTKYPTSFAPTLIEIWQRHKYRIPV